MLKEIYKAEELVTLFSTSKNEEFALIRTNKGFFFTAREKTMNQDGTPNALYYYIFKLIKSKRSLQNQVAT